MVEKLTDSNESPKLICTVRENAIECQIIDENDTYSEYAFYLKRDGERIRTIWYSKEKNVSFQIDLSGIYTISGFVKNIETEEKKMLLSDEMIFHWPKTIDIFGSCVSRDLFEFEKIKRFKIGTYVARESILSAVSPAIEFEEGAIQLSSSFQKRMVEYDLKSNGLDCLKKSASDYLVVDLIDERFDIAQIGDAFITLSTEFTLSKVLDSNVYSIIKKNDMFFKEHESLIYESVDKFCERILEIYDPGHVIIHKAYMVNTYIDKRGKKKKFSLPYLSFNKRINDILTKMYARMESRMTDAMVVDISSGYYADENHKWGLAPKHYQKEYYIAALNEIYLKINKKE